MSEDKEICSVCQGTETVMGNDGKLTLCLNCRYGSAYQKIKGINEPFQEIYDKAKEVENRKRNQKEEAKEEDKRILEKVEKIKRLSKRDKESWVEFNILKNKFERMGII